MLVEAAHNMSKVLLVLATGVPGKRNQHEAKCSNSEIWWAVAAMSFRGSAGSALHDFSDNRTKEAAPSMSLASCGLQKAFRLTFGV